MSILIVIGRILFIVFFFGFAIFIHEFGHLLAAIWRGLHVEKFSVGFGPKIWGFTRKGIEFVVSWLPFGGYVMLPQLDPADVPKTTKGEELPIAKPVDRAVTAFAGPFFNILFGFLLATVLWGVGLYQAAPSHSCIVTEVPAVLPLYKDGLELGDLILAVNDETYPEGLTWEEVCDKLPETTDELKLTIWRKGQQETLLYHPEINPEWQGGLRQGDRITRINGQGFSGGIKDLTEKYIFVKTPKVTVEVVSGNGEVRELSWSPAPNPLMENLGAPFFAIRNPVAVHSVKADSLGARAGFLPGDQVVAVNDQAVMDPADLKARLLPDAAGTMPSVRISRQGEDMVLTGLPPQVGPSLNVLAELGLSFASINATEVLPDSPAEKAGFREGDRILSLDGREVTDTEDFISSIRNSQGREVLIGINRHGRDMQLKVTPVQNNVDGKPTYQIGMLLESENARILGHPTPWRQFTDVLSMTGRSLSLLFLPVSTRVSNVVSGRHEELPRTKVGVRHMSGPLGIIMAIWYRLQQDGLRGGLSFIVLITFSLALVNLLPLPVLDGGHILYAIIELIIRRRLPVKVINALQNIFSVLLIGLMLYITFFDGNRIWQRLRLWSNSDDAPPPSVQTAPEGEEEAK